MYCNMAAKLAFAPVADVTPISLKNAVLPFVLSQSVKLLRVATASVGLRKSVCVPEPS